MGGWVRRQGSSTDRGLMYRGLMLGLGSGIHAWLDLEFHAMISLRWLWFGLGWVGLGF